MIRTAALVVLLAASALAREGPGDRWLALGEIEKAAAAYARTIEESRRAPGGQDAKVARPLSGLALCRFRQHRLREAERLCREALALREGRQPPDYAGIRESLLLLAEILNAAGRGPEAEECRARAAVLSPERLRAERESRWRAVRHAAGLAEVAKNLPRAEAEWRKALQAAGEEEAQRRTALAGLGRVLLARGRAGEALPMLRQAARLFAKAPPDEAFARVRNLLRLADALDITGREPETAAPLREALPLLLKVREANAAPWVLEGSARALAAAGREEEALPLVGKLPKESLVRSDLLLFAGRHREAERGYRLAIVRDPSDGRPWLGIARIRLAEGRLDEAEIYARKGMALRGESPAARELLATIVGRLGRGREAAALRAGK